MIVASAKPTRFPVISSLGKYALTLFPSTSAGRVIVSFSPSAKAESSFSLTASLTFSSSVSVLGHTVITRLLLISLSP